MKKLCPTCRQALPEDEGLVIDNDRGEVRYFNLVINLTNQEQRLLTALAMAPGRCLSKEKLMDTLYWDRRGGEDVEIKVIDVFICKLRKKLAPLTAAGVSIKTHWGKGYEFIAPGVVSKKDAVTVGASEVSDLSYGAL
jgi:DNA-binding response OmpR family regulator